MLTWKLSSLQSRFKISVWLKVCYIFPLELIANSYSCEQDLKKIKADNVGSKEKISIIRFPTVLVSCDWF